VTCRRSRQSRSTTNTCTSFPEVDLLGARAPAGRKIPLRHRATSSPDHLLKVERLQGGTILNGTILNGTILNGTILNGTME
jgi:hypothetical protein